MARINEKDSFKYHKLDNQFKNHYLINSFNQALDLIEGNYEHKDIAIHNLMSGVEATVNRVKELESEIEKKNKFINFLQNKLMELL